MKSRLKLKIEIFVIKLFVSMHLPVVQSSPAKANINDLCKAVWMPLASTACRFSQYTCCILPVWAIVSFFIPFSLMTFWPIWVWKMWFSFLKLIIMLEVINQLCGLIWVTWIPWYPVKNRSKIAWLDIQTYVLGYPSTCVWKSVCNKMQYLNSCLLTSRITVIILCS